MGIFSKIINTWFSNSASTPVVSKSSVSLSQSDKKIIEDSARSMVHVINESLKIANESVIYDTRVSRIQVVKDTLARLKELSILYPDVSIVSLDSVEVSIKAVERETRDMMAYVLKNASESVQQHNSRMGEIITDKDSVLNGIVYAATLQLRTPLWILLKDGEKWSEGTPPEVGEPWMGIWVPELKTWKELGFEGIKEFGEGSCASDIGPVKRSKYLPFLIEVRGVIETEKTMESKIKSLQTIMAKKKYAEMVNQNDNHNRIMDMLYPPVISTRNGLTPSLSASLRELNISTVRQLREMPDKDFLAIKGIGASALKKIREFSDNYVGDDTLDRIAAVEK
jgi:hypothetical protein